MKKTFYIFLFFLFLASTAISQNIYNPAKANPSINPPDNFQANDIPNQDIAMNNAPQAVYPQQVVNPQQVVYPQQAQVQVQAQGQVEAQGQQRGQGENILQNVFASNNNNSVNKSVNVASSNHSLRSYSGFSSSSKSHSKKSLINLHKVHILRKFRNEFPLFKAKTYQNLFTSKKHKVKHCFFF